MATTRIDDLRMLDPVLTTIAQGYSNAAMVAEHLFPTIEVSKLKGKIPVFERNAFIIRDTHRAIRANSNRIPPSDINFIEFETKEKDIEIAIDYIEEEESLEGSLLEHRLAKELRDILLLGKEKEAADLVQNPNNFINDLKLVITEDTCFNDYYNSTNPLLVIKDAMVSIKERIAHYPNTMIIGNECYQTLLEHPKIVEKVMYSGISKVTKKILEQLFDISNIHIGLSVYSEDGENFQDVWKDNIILAYVDPSNQNRSEFNPSFGYTLQRVGMPEIDSYYENGGKTKIIRATDNYAIKVTASDACYLIYNTNHPLD